jgi:hypothetical protein
MVPTAVLGFAGWRLLHFAVLPLLGWRLALVALILWPFWQDANVGNVVTFAVVFALLALRGNRFGTVAFFGLFLLAPRPFLLPVAAWLLWQRPAIRVPVAIVFVAQLVVVAALGYLDEWARAMVQPGLDFGSWWEFGPAKWMGLAWPLIGLPLAAFLTWRGRLGLASLAASPYWLGYYLLMLLLELRPSSSANMSDTSQPGVAATMPFVPSRWRTLAIIPRSKSSTRTIQKPGGG